MLVVSSRGEFYEIVSNVLCSWFPNDAKLFLFDSVFEPIEMYVNCFHHFLFHCSSDDATSNNVVSNERCCWLLMSEINEGNMLRDSFLYAHI